MTTTTTTLRGIMWRLQNSTRHHAQRLHPTRHHAWRLVWEPLSNVLLASTRVVTPTPARPKSELRLLIIQRLPLPPHRL